MQFVDKYRPKSLKEIRGHKIAIQELENYIKNFKRGKALLLYGKPGSGKTSAVYAAANQFDLELLEINASDYRNSEQIEATVGQASKQMSLFFKKKLILIDEVDGLAGREDRGGVSALVKLIKSSAFPIVLTANNPWDAKFSSLRNASVLIEFRTLSYISVLSVLKNVCLNENLEADEKTLTALARSAGGDLRGALTDLQTLSLTKNFSFEDIDDLGSRRKTERIFDALLKIFKTTNSSIARKSTENLNESADELMLWIDENYPKEYTHPKDVVRAAEVLAHVDRLRGRIRRRNYWRFLAYIMDFLSAGIALAKERKYDVFTRFSRTQRVLKIWRANQKYAKRKSVSKKIAKYTRTSTKIALKDTLPYVRFMIRNKPEFIYGFREFFNFSDDEVNWLANIDR